jgi:hypothetical protein
MNGGGIQLQTPEWLWAVVVVALAALIIGLIALIRCWRRSIAYEIDEVRYDGHLSPYSSKTLELALRNGAVIGRIYRRCDYGLRLEDGYTFEDGMTERKFLVKNRGLPISHKCGIWTFQRLA